jgi:putative SOS response-associated peptidase YedK
MFIQGVVGETPEVQERNGKRSQEPFAFVGLCYVWRKPDGGKVESFTLITTEP